jgi:glyoxylase-like metal-dependent hydrolase (beta-lactamase superfamily II)
MFEVSPTASDSPEPSAKAQGMSHASWRPASVINALSRRTLAAVVCLIAIAFNASIAQAEDEDPANDELRTTHVGGSVSQIEAIGGFGGGNVAVSVGADGVLLVDSMTRRIAPKLKAALSQLSPEPARILINTHFHGDHAGGNLDIGASAIIVAQDNVRARLHALHMPDKGLPVVAYQDELRIHFNGEDIRLLHCADAHTDGDTIVVFPTSRVAHFGDLYFNGMFPAVYTQGGGTWHGLIDCLDRVIPQLPEDTRIIAGHGALSDMKALHAYLDMLKETTRIVEEHLKRGESAQDMIHANVLAAFDSLGKGGAQTTDQYIGMLTELLGRDAAGAAASTR